MPRRRPIAEINLSSIVLVKKEDGPKAVVSYPGFQELGPFPVPIAEDVHDGRYDVRTYDQRIHEDGETEGESEFLHHLHSGEHEGTEGTSHDESADGDDRTGVGDGMMDSVIVALTLDHVLLDPRGQEDIVIHSQSKTYH